MQRRFGRSAEGLAEPNRVEQRERAPQKPCNWLGYWTRFIRSLRNDNEKWFSMMPRPTMMMMMMMVMETLDESDRPHACEGAPKLTPRRASRSDLRRLGCATSGARSRFAPPQSRAGFVGRFEAAAPATITTDCVQRARCVPSSSGAQEATCCRPTSGPRRHLFCTSPPSLFAWPLAAVDNYHQQLALSGEPNLLTVVMSGRRRRRPITRAARRPAPPRPGHQQVVVRAIGLTSARLAYEAFQWARHGACRIHGRPSS